jgi:hypothetical protein
MAFNPSADSGEYHYLVEFVLDSTTLLYAEEDLSIQTTNLTGAFYEGRLPQTGVLSRGLGTFLEAKETVDSFPIVLDNRDGAIQRHIQEFEFANRNVNVWLGEGRTKSNYSLVFPGFVTHPNGIGWDEDSASFNVIDRRLKDRKVIPNNVFETSEFPNLQNGASGTAIPIVYGNFASTVSSQVGVPAVCVSMTATDKKFKVADHRLKSIDKVLKNGLRVAYANVSLDDASFTVPSSVTYTATTDTMSVNCQGICVSSGGTLIDKPQDVLQNIYTSYMGLTGGDLNSTSFSDLDTDVTESCRSFINTRVSTETIVGELINEASIDMRFVGGKYSPKYRSLDVASERTSYFDSDITIDDFEKADFSVENDPDRFYANKISSRYNFDPTYGVYLGSYTRELATEIANVSTVIERPMTFNWFYDKTQTETRVQRELVTYGNEPVNVTLTLTNRALLENLADQIDLTYNVFDSRTFQIRRMETDLASMTTRISATDVFILGVGRWTDNSAPNWSTATESERESQGFWSTNTGYATSTDPASLNRSLWF